MKIERTKVSSNFPSSLLNNAKLIEYRWETLLFAQFILLNIMKNHPVTERKRLVYNSAPWANLFSLRSPVQILFILPHYDCNLTQLHAQKSWHLHASLITFCSFGSCISDSFWPVFQLNMGDVIKIRLCFFLLRWHSSYTQHRCCHRAQESPKINAKCNIPFGRMLY